MSAHPSPTPPQLRSGALGRLTAKKAIAALPPSAIAHKYQVLDAICIAKDRLGLKDGSIAVLRALVSFHPEETLRAEESLVVHPSNRLLQGRANGMTMPAFGSAIRAPKRESSVLVSETMVPSRSMTLTCEVQPACGVAAWPMLFSLAA